MLNVHKNTNQAYANTEQDLALISEWFAENLLTLNVEKSSSVCFTISNNGILANNGISMHSCSLSDDQRNCPRISNVRNVKYLGVTLDNNLNWKQHIEAIANRLRALLCKIYYLRKIVTLKTLKMFYFAMGQSILQYSIACWGGTHFSIIDPIVKLQNKIIRAILFKTQREHSHPLYQQLGILPARHLYVYKTITNFRKKGEHDTTRLRTNYHTRTESQHYVVQPKVSKEKLHK